MRLGSIPHDKAHIPAEVINDLDAVLERMRRLVGVVGISDQIEFCKVLRVYFEIKVRAIERAARAWRDDLHGLDTPQGPVLVPMPTPGGDGGAA